MMTTTTTTSIPTVSNQKAWLSCIGLQATAGVLALFSFPPSVLVMGIGIGLSSAIFVVLTLSMVRSLRVSLHNKVHPYKNWLVSAWFVGSLLLVAIHPALLVVGLVPLVQFQRFLPKFTLSQVPWLVGAASVVLVGLSAWQIKINPSSIKLLAYGVNTALWMSSFIPLLLACALTQVHLRTLLEVKNGQLLQQSALALTDALTGLGNRRYFDETLTREMARTKRNGSPLSLVLLDIDFFKKINDVYGHTTGDTVLKELATLIASNLRQCDWIARYGGEEYALILPDTPCLEALKLLERLRLLVEKHVFDRDHSPMKVTVSLGITQYDVKRHTLESFIAEADEALYEAKNHGRNQVRVYGLGASGDTLVNPQVLIEARHTNLYAVG